MAELVVVFVDMAMYTVVKKIIILWREVKIDGRRVKNKRVCVVHW
jgi:hypothetical protein